MAHIVILGAGLGGSIMAYELSEQIRKEDRITVVARKRSIASSPRTLDCSRLAQARDITIDLADTMQKERISNSAPPPRKRSIRRKTGSNWSTGHRSTTTT
ncbi:MAG: hypothetical protein R3D46_00650 [Defluviimonas denitrificans]